jgi:transcription elongation factor GreB
VSKAFKKDDDDEPLVVVPRAPLPDGVPNYVTGSGLAALRSELRELVTELARLVRDEQQPSRNALKVRIAELEQRLVTAEFVDPEQQPHDEVRFGARVELVGASGKSQRYRIVGVDEANVGDGRIAFTAPLARALLGRSVGDVVRVKTPHGEDELELVHIEYGER